MSEPPFLRPRHHPPVAGEVKRIDADQPADARRRRTAAPFAINLGAAHRIKKYLARA